MKACTTCGWAHTSDCQGVYAKPAPSQWELDCAHWRGPILTGRYAHYCPEWDGLPIDETCYVLDEESGEWHGEWPCGCQFTHPSFGPELHLNCPACSCPCPIADAKLRQPVSNRTCSHCKKALVFLPKRRKTPARLALAD